MIIIIKSVDKTTPVTKSRKREVSIVLKSELSSKLHSGIATKYVYSMLLGNEEIKTAKRFVFLSII